MISRIISLALLTYIFIMNWIKRLHKLALKKIKLIWPFELVWSNNFIQHRELPEWPQYLLVVYVVCIKLITSQLQDYNSHPICVNIHSYSDKLKHPEDDKKTYIEWVDWGLSVENTASQNWHIVWHCVTESSPEMYMNWQIWHKSDYGSQHSFISTVIHIS